jgi:hypothetical protein
VWNALVKGMPLALHHPRAAQPIGPSVAMWTISGSNAHRLRRVPKRGSMASRISL